MEPLFKQLESANQLVNFDTANKELPDRIEECFKVVLEDTRTRLDSDLEEMRETFMMNPTHIDQLCQLIDERLAELKIQSPSYEQLKIVIDLKPSLNIQLQSLYDFVKDGHPNKDEFEKRVKPVHDIAVSILGTFTEREVINDSPDIYKLIPLIQKRLQELNIKSQLFDLLVNATLNY